MSIEKSTTTPKSDVEEKAETTTYITGPEINTLMLELTKFLQAAEQMGGNDYENEARNIIRKLQVGELVSRAEASKILSYFGNPLDKNVNYH